jgi:uncharacterized protein YkwD
LAVVVATVGLVSPSAAAQPIAQFGGPPTGLVSALAATDEESQFKALINASRAGASMPALSLDADLVVYARSHTAEMSGAGKIFHSGTNQLQGVSSGWSLLGENVGLGPNPQILHEAFMNSASHRANIMGQFNYVGVGAEHDAAGTLFVTVIFMQKTPPVATTAPPTTLAAPAVLAKSTPSTTTTTTLAATATATTLPLTSHRHLSDLRGNVGGTWCVRVGRSGHSCAL